MDLEPSLLIEYNLRNGHRAFVIADKGYLLTVYYSSDKTLGTISAEYFNECVVSVNMLYEPWKIPEQVLILYGPSKATTW